MQNRAGHRTPDENRDERRQNRGAGWRPCCRARKAVEAHGARRQPVQENGGASIIDGSDFELSEVELMTLSESRGDYLENLLILETRSGGFVRQVDMASRMGFSKANISKAMSSLSAEGYVEFRPRGLVRL